MSPMVDIFFIHIFGTTEYNLVSRCAKEKSMKRSKKNIIDIKFKLSTYKIILIVFIGGLIIGSIYANLMDAAKLNEIQNINSYFYEKYQFVKIDYVDLLGNVLFDRVKIVTMIWILGLTFLAIPVV